MCLLKALVAVGGYTGRQARRLLEQRDEPAQAREPEIQAREEGEAQADAPEEGYALAALEPPGHARTEEGIPARIPILAPPPSLPERLLPDGTDD